MNRLFSYLGQQLSSLIVLLGSALLLTSLMTTSAHARTWKPGPGWGDSYAVDGVCYCASSNYDHGIGSKMVMTPDGHLRSVVDICADIKRVFGEGATEGRIPYNTIACGNGPANDAEDEHLTTGCPGRVDKGEDGCFMIGPQWPLSDVYGAPMQALIKQNWTFTSSHNQRGLEALVDGDVSTRWTTGTPQAAGQWLSVDLGEIYAVDRIELLSTPSPNDFPRGWKLEGSVDGKVWVVLNQGLVEDTAQAQAQAQVPLTTVAAITRLSFPTQLLRHLRIEQTAAHPKWYWSVHELRLGISFAYAADYSD